MNKVYRSIWNTTTNTWTAAAETAKSRSKGSARAARRAVVALALGGASMGGAFAADVCTTEDDRKGLPDSAGICTPASVSTMSTGSIGTTATLDDTYIKVLPATTGGTAATATGTGAMAMGNAANSNGAGALAIGSAATSNGTGSLAIGRLSNASNTASAAIGDQSSAQGMSAIAIGSSAKANGTGTSAFGRIAQAGADMATAIGNATSAMASGTTALGSGATVAAGATNSVAIGSQASIGANVTNSVALGAGSTTTRNNTVAVGGSGAGQQRQIVNMAAGNLSDTSTDAVNGAQLYATNQNVAKNTADIGALNGRVTVNEQSITDIRNEMNNGAIGLVQQDASTKDITVAAATGGNKVDFTGQDGVRKLTGIDDGEVKANSSDAVTGGQLYTTNEAVAKNASDIGALDGRVTNNEASITNIRGEMSSGTIGLVKQDQNTGAITVASGTGGNVMSFAGQGGVARTLTGVANGVDDSDAVTIAQLKATGLIDYTGKELGALVYDDLTLGMATLGGVNGTVLNNVAPGLIGMGSMQAVNGGQLFDLQQKVENYYADLDDRVGVIEQGGAGGGSGGGGTPGGSVPSPGTGKDSVAIGEGSNASGAGSTAVGVGSNASADGSTAIGNGASATHDNSMALGADSKTDRDNSVSVGSEGNARQITNVAEGTADTDAVNVGQLNRNIGNLQNQIDSNRRDAAGGTATAVAIANLPQASLPGESVMSLGAGSYDGESAMAIGVSTATKDGRWLLKASGSTNTRGSSAIGAGVGFRW